MRSSSPTDGKPLPLPLEKTEGALWLKRQQNPTDANILAHIECWNALGKLVGHLALNRCSKCGCGKWGRGHKDLCGNCGHREENDNEH